MNKKYIVSLVFAGVVTLAGSVGAVANIEGSNYGSVKSEETSVESNTEVQVKTDTDNTATTNTGTKTDSENGSSERVLPTVNKVELEGNLEVDSERVLPTVNKKTTAKVSVMGWDAVKKEQVEAKVQAELEANPEIKSVEVTENKVEINYSAPAKFFGLFPVNFNLNIMADADGKVKVKFPWYRFLLKTEFSNSAGVLNAVFQNNQTNLEFLKAKASEDRQVEIFIQISNSLKVMHEMSKSIISKISA